MTVSVQAQAAKGLREVVPYSAGSTVSRCGTLKWSSSPSYRRNHECEHANRCVATEVLHQLDGIHHNSVRLTPVARGKIGRGCRGVVRFFLTHE